MLEQESFRLFTTNDVLKRYTISRTTLWRMIKSGKFPKPLPLYHSHTWHPDQLRNFDTNLLTSVAVHTF